MLIQETLFQSIFTLLFSFYLRDSTVKRGKMSMLKTEKKLNLLLMLCPGPEHWCVRHMKESFTYNHILESSHLPVLLSPTSSLNGRALLFFQVTPLPFHSCPANLIFSLKLLSLCSAAPLYLTPRCINLNVFFLFAS